MTQLELEHTELSEKVYRLLKKMILNREFVGGQRLDLHDLSKKLQISRTPLKDAINRLAVEGLVEVKPRSGTFVTVVNTGDIKHIMEMRMMMETWCMTHLSGEHLAQLAKTLRGVLDRCSVILETKPFSFHDFLDEDIRFHHEIVKVNGNPRMLEHYQSLNSFLHALRIYYFQSYETSLIGQREHSAVVEALEHGDSRAAYAALSRHLSNSREKDGCPITGRRRILISEEAYKNTQTGSVLNNGIDFIESCRVSV